MLIAAGHAAKDVWDYTPRQIYAFMFLANRRRKREAIEKLTLEAIASSGNVKNIKETLKKLKKDDG